MDKNKTEVYLTTGEFARLCDVNKRTLFHYDEIGLLKPALTNEKGYRYYSHRQLDVFLLIQILKDLKMPLKEIRSYLDNRTAGRMIEMAKQEILHIDKEIAKLQENRQVLEETITFAEEGLAARHGEFRLEDQEEERLIRSGVIADGDPRAGYLEWSNDFRKFDQLTQFDASSFIGTMVEIRNLLTQDGSAVYYFVKTNSNSTNLKTFTKPKGRYAVGYHHGCYDKLDETYIQMFNYIGELGLTQGEYAYEEYLIDDVAVKNPEDYVTRITLEVR
ncbi:MerR family transcriptional regulator [Paenibacillus sp. PK3_47]|uniref:MerR family transcriptional regulator n=1 Tax=Paenibacillus sp. PK3_47 TaxID=2072642 RepID=UPI00201E2386|nr:MerR family transcriptional regulator [Paenibacillus sp. PK3_47]UQZ36922.1 MerR family transcriptional regulator [Paenibacillus sp. PK3_47]